MPDKYRPIKPKSIAGAILIDGDRAGLRVAGFEHAEILHSGKDLHTDAKVENQTGCCSPKMDASNPFQAIEESCCSSAPNASGSLHDELKRLLSQYDINAAAASVEAYAIKQNA